MPGVRHWFFRFRTRLASGGCLAASVCRHAQWVGMPYRWLVHPPARFPRLGSAHRCRWRFCPLWGSPHLLPGVHRGLLELWLGWGCGRRGCVARRSRRLSGVAFPHGRRPGPASWACGPRDVSQDGDVCRVWARARVGGPGTGR